MGDSGSVDQSISHHNITHRNITDKRKSSACNVSVLSGDADFAATLYGITANSGHHSHDHSTNSNTLSANSHRLTSEQQHHSGKCKSNSMSKFMSKSL
jgi:hypothetical protein